MPGMPIYNFKTQIKIALFIGVVMAILFLIDFIFNLNIFIHEKTNFISSYDCIFIYWMC
jgi:hypothetical protein